VLDIPPYKFRGFNRFVNIEVVKYLKFDILSGGFKYIFYIERIGKIMKKCLKKCLCVVLIAVLLMMAGCGSGQDVSEDTATTAETTTASTEDSGTAAEDKSDETEAATATASADTAEEIAADDDAASDEATVTDGTAVRVGMLKGPTAMGLVYMMKADEYANNYDFEMYVQPSDVMAAMVAGDLDIALVPANVAAVMNNKVEGGVSVIDINTLGVLYCVTGDESIASIKDLAGKTVITTGQGATPEYSLRYLLDKNGVTDCNIEFKSESTEVAAVLAGDSSQIAVLPQPFVSVALMQNEELSMAFSLDDEWNAVSDNGSKLVTGVTVVANSFLNENPEAVDTFLEKHSSSIFSVTKERVDEAPSLIAEYGIIEKEAVADMALSYCNITFLAGSAMKSALSGYLEVLYDYDPTSVGGSLPGDEFYYMWED